MSMMMGRDNRLYQTSQHRAYNRSGKTVLRRFPGRIVSVIAVKPKGLGPNEYNPLFLYFAVSRYRKDYGKVLQQIDQQKRAELPKYENSLFESCFKNW